MRGGNSGYAEIFEEVFMQTTADIVFMYCVYAYNSGYRRQKQNRFMQRIADLGQKKYRFMQIIADKTN